MMRAAHGRKAYAHMNNGQFEALYIGRPGGSYKYGYIISCWNNRRATGTRYLQGYEIIGAVEDCVHRCESFVRGCATGGR